MARRNSWQQSMCLLAGGLAATTAVGQLAPPLLLSDATQLPIYGKQHQEKFGYDIEHGTYIDFFRGNTILKEVVAVGAPLYDDLANGPMGVDVGRVGVYRFNGAAGSFGEFQELPSFEIIGDGIPGSAFGRNITRADFNGDGWDELIVSAPGDNPGFQGRGVLKIYQNSGTSLVFTEVGTITGEQDGDNFGWSVDAKDLNGDQVDDLIIGAPSWSQCLDCDFADRDWTGRVYVIYGQQDSIRQVDAVDADITVTGHINQPENGVYKFTKNRFGYDVQGFELVPGKTLSYFAATAFRATADDAPDRNDCDVWDGLDGIDYDCRKGVAMVFPVQLLDPIPNPIDAYSVPSAMLKGDEQVNAKYGWNMAAGNFKGDSDGYQDDLVIGATEAMESRGGFLENGHVIVSAINPNGTENRLGAFYGENLPAAEYDSLYGLFVPPPEGGDRFGWWVDDCGDINDDGQFEIVVSSPYWPDKDYDTGNGPSKHWGRISVIDWTTGTVLFEVLGNYNEGQIGWAFWSHHDFTALELVNGPKDLLITAPNASDGSEKPGALYFFKDLF